MDDIGPVEIAANTVLPARREPVVLHTADGLALVGELASPLDRDPVATLVTLHPLPTHGGFMDSHVIRKAAWRLPALAGIAVLRFNTRGTASPAGRSEGAFDDGVGERFDVAAAIEYAEFHDLPRRWLLGWSFGTELALMHGLDPGVEGAVLLRPRCAGPPTRTSTRGRPRPAARLPRPRARRLPPAGRGAPPVRAGAAGRGRRGGRAPSTCGSASPTCAACSTRSWPASSRRPRRCRPSGTVQQRR